MPAPSPVLLPASLAQVDPFVQMIVAGQLVILPTETVYAIAVNLREPESRQRLGQIKGWQMGGRVGGGTPVGPPTPWVLHLGDPWSLREWFFPDLFPLAIRIIRRGLPGPIALELPVLSDDLERFQRLLGDVWPEVLHGGEAGRAWATFRIPEQTITQAVLEGVWRRGVPVALVGVSGSLGAAGGSLGRVLSGDGGDVLSQVPNLADHVAAVLDAGPPRYHKPSTLVRVTPERAQVLRAGVFDERIIQRLAQTLILFVCTGNTCRSPMAAALARHVLAQRFETTPAGLAKRNILVESAGLHACAGTHATPEAQDAVRSVLGSQKNGGGDLAAHAAQQISKELLQRADVIFTMTDAQRDEILHFWPAAAAKTYRLDPAGDVEDPIGGDESLYRQVAERLQAVLWTRLNEIRL